MSVSIDRSTYNDIINDIIGDIEEVDVRQAIAPEQYLNWINRAQQEICKRIGVFEQIPLKIIDGQTDYPLQDRPLVSAATNATPIVMTAASHGLSNGDRINIRDVEGNTAANGQRQIESVATNTMALLHYADIEDASNESPISITTKQKHGWSTGDLITITGVLGNTAANVTDNAITVVDEYTFTLDGTTGNDEYTSGGIATKDVAGSGAYTYGGQFWEESEIPTFVKDIAGIRRTWENIYRPVIMVGQQQMMDTQIFESTFGLVRSAYSNPVQAAFVTVNGQRYLRFFDEPSEDEDSILIAKIELVPERYSTANLDSMIFLRSNYDESIKSYVKQRLYEKLEMPDKVKFHMSMFLNAVNIEKLGTTARPIIRTTYR